MYCTMYIICTVTCQYTYTCTVHCTLHVQYIILQSKRRDYEDRIIHIEHGTFSPLVFSTSGGMGPIANTVFSRIASMISSKTNTTYSKVVLYIRTKISFALIRSAIRCLRGSRSTFNNSTPSHNIQLALSEGRVTY